MSETLATILRSRLRDVVARSRPTTRTEHTPRWLEPPRAAPDLLPSRDVVPNETPSPEVTSGSPLTPSSPSLSRPEHVSDGVSVEATIADLATRHGGREKYSDEDLLQAIRRVADVIGEVPSSTSYQRSARDLGLPSLATVANRFGTWTAAVWAAGMTPHASNGSQTQRWSPDVCWRTLVNLTTDLGGPPTMDQYELLATGNDELPSPATVRNRLGAWSGVTARLRSADAHPVLGRLGITRDIASEQRDEQILLAHLADKITDDELQRLVHDGLFQWRGEYGEAPDGLRTED
jgi:hypothetical protein